MDELVRTADEVLRKNLGKKEKLYGIFDGAVIESLWVNIEIWDLDSMPLFKGDYEKIAEAIPYLIELDAEKDQLACDTLLENIGKNAILFITSTLELRMLTKKMQYFYHVKTSAGEAVLRRYYDPRNFTDFMKGMNGDNRMEFFKGISAYFSEDQQKKELVRYKKEGNELKKETFSLVTVENS